MQTTLDIKKNENIYLDLATSSSRYNTLLVEPFIIKETLAYSQLSLISLQSQKRGTDLTVFFLINQKKEYKQVTVDF